MPTQSLAESKSPKLNPAVFTKHYRKIRDLKVQQDDVSSELRLAKKAAKTDGVDLDALRLMEKLAKLDDDEAELQLRHMHQYATWLKMPLGTQFGLFGTTVAPKGKELPDEDGEADDFDGAEVEEAGAEACKHGVTRSSNPHSVGSKPFAAWDKGWMAHVKGALSPKEDSEPKAESANGAKPTRARKGNGQSRSVNQAPRARGKPKNGDAAALV